MGAGIAVPIKKKFKLSDMKDNVEAWLLKSPTCLYYKGVLNLITKSKYWHKPTYNSIGSALIGMKFLIERHGLHKIVMPKIGSGLDGLSWPRVREIIKDIFKDTDIEILVCHI
jgi:O-acetyl-ADP-ribose deacetylase (regulator of RNase III)